MTKTGDGQQDQGQEKPRSRGPSLNRVMLIGRLAADPDMRFMQDGRAITNMRLATNWQQRTQYHSLVAFGQEAKFAGEYLSKGRSVYAEGHLQERQWQDQEGRTHRATEVILSNLQALAPPPQRSSQREEADQEAER